jgi:hypothetical protein
LFCRRAFQAHPALPAGHLPPRTPIRRPPVQLRRPLAAARPLSPRSVTICLPLVPEVAGVTVRKLFFAPASRAAAVWPVRVTRLVRRRPDHSAGLRRLTLVTFQDYATPFPYWDQESRFLRLTSICFRGRTRLTDFPSPSPLTLYGRSRRLPEAQPSPRGSIPGRGRQWGGIASHRVVLQSPPSERRGSGPSANILSREAHLSHPALG